MFRRKINPNLSYKCFWAIKASKIVKKTKPICPKSSKMRMLAYRFSGLPIFRCQKYKKQLRNIGTQHVYADRITKKVTFRCKFLKKGLKWAYRFEKNYNFR